MKTEKIHLVSSEVNPRIWAACPRKQPSVKRVLSYPGARHWFLCSLPSHPSSSAGWNPTALLHVTNSFNKVIPPGLSVFGARDQPKAAQLAFTEVPRCTAPPSLPRSHQPSVWCSGRALSENTAPEKRNPSENWKMYFPLARQSTGCAQLCSSCVTKSIRWHFTSLKSCFKKKAEGTPFIFAEQNCYQGLVCSYFKLTHCFSFPTAQLSNH